MRLKLKTLLILLIVAQFQSFGQVSTKTKLIGVFTQQLFYRFTIVEFKTDMTFDYHIMSERAHRRTSGKFNISGDTIILDSYSKDTDFDFQNKKWIILSRKQILTSGDLNDRKENWSILERDKKIDSIPNQRSDFALKIDSIKINELSWIMDTNDYNAELKLIIHEPSPSKEPIVIIDNKPIKYNFFLDYYKLEDIETIKVEKSDKFSKFYGWRAVNGVIFVKTKKPKR